VPLFSTFSDEPLGALLVVHDPGNLTRYFTDATTWTTCCLSMAWRKPGFARNRCLESDETLQTIPKSVCVWLWTGILRSLPGQFHPQLCHRPGDRHGSDSQYCILVANYILHPILLLSSTAREVTGTQDYSKRVTVGRSDEIGQLATAFNSMISGMQVMIAR